MINPQADDERNQRGSGGSGQSGRAPVDAVVAALAAALDTTMDEGTWFAVQPPRTARRSTVHVIGTPTPVRGLSRWLVKQSHSAPELDDVPSPVSGQQEFLAVTRLHAHFQQIGGRARVPAPIGFFPALGALAMEYVPGRSLSDLLSYRSLLHPARLLDGVTAAAEFIRHVHDLEGFAPRPINLSTEAKAVLSAAHEKLHPYRLSLPHQVSQALSEVPPVVVASRQVLLHGDFCPPNIILAEDGSAVGIDTSLDIVGPPEEDLVRFVAVMSRVIRFPPEVVAPPVGWLRRRLETQLLTRYYGSSTRPRLFELRVINQLAGRWLRLRQFANRHDRPSLVRIKMQVVDAQIGLLMGESSRRLVRSLAQAAE